MKKLCIVISAIGIMQGCFGLAFGILAEYMPIVIMSSISIISASLLISILVVRK